MATTVSRIPISGAAHGVGVLVVATATAGTLIHTAQSSATDCDVVTLYATNNDTAAINLTIEYGGVSSPTDLIKLSIPATSGLTLVLPDLVIRNSLVIRAFAGTASKITIHGFVNRVTTV